MIVLIIVVAIVLLAVSRESSCIQACETDSYCADLVIASHVLRLAWTLLTLFV